MKAVTAVLLFFLATALLQAQSAAALLGKWITNGDKAHVEIYFEGGKYHGRVVWLRDTLDDKGQPVCDEKGQVVMNMVVVQNFDWVDVSLTNGLLYHPESCKSYYGVLTLVSPDVLKVRGSIDKNGWIGRTELWHRLK